MQARANRFPRSARTAGVLLILLCATGAAVAGPWNVGLQPAAAEDGTIFPADLLRSARYEVDVFGSVALGTLEQEFVNGAETPLTVTYLASRPTGLKIRGLEAGTGGELSDAMHEPAASAVSRTTGRTRRGASTGDRPARLKSRPIELAPGATLTVRVEFRMTLPVHEGRFVLRLPSVQAGDAILPTAGPAELAVRVHVEQPLIDVDSSTHELFVVFDGARTLVEVERGGADPASDYEVAFEIGAAQEPTLVGYAQPEADGSHRVVLVLAPPAEPREGSARPKQVLFVLDTSGSMHKGKLAQARIALAGCLEKLGPEDRFNVVEFDKEFTLLRPEPVDPTEVTPAQAVGWLDGLVAAGATNLLPALAAGFEQPEDPGRHRMIVVLTDGAFHDERGVLDLVDSKLGHGRLFVVGIGDDVRKPTIERLADRGRGVAVFADDSEGLEPALAGLFDSVSRPMAWDLELDWGGARAELIEPRHLPDLYAGRAVTVRARVKGPLPSSVELHGMTMDGLRSFTSTLAVPGETTDRPNPRRGSAAGRSRR